MDKRDINENESNQTNRPLLDDRSNLNENFTEETATEIADDNVIIEDRSKDRNDPDVNSIYGWIGVGLSLISFFIIPLLFAGAGIILGFIARNREAQILGNTAIIIGLISILTRLFILPLI